VSIEVPQKDILHEGIEAEAERGDRCANKNQFKICQMFHNTITF
jgi:hypothetical protein